MPDALVRAPGSVPKCGDLIGKPFKWGGRGPHEFDCYGLVMEVERRAGRAVPDYMSPSVQEEVARQIDRFRPFWTPCEEGPGAVVEFRIGRFISHVGILLPHGRLLHSWERSGGVCVERIEEWRRRITGFYIFNA